MTTTTIPSTVLPASLRTVPTSETYMVKSFTEHETSRGVYMSGNLYRGTKKVAYLENQGTGGEIMIHFLFKTKANTPSDADIADRSAEVMRFKAWSDEWIALNPGGAFGFGASQQDVLFTLMEEAGRMKELNRGKVMRIMTADEILEGKIDRRFNSVDLTSAVHRNQLCAQHGPDALYWDKTTKTWKKVADAR